MKKFLSLFTTVIITMALILSVSFQSVAISGGRWEKSGNYWYYYNNDQMATGWIFVDNSWFYMNNSGQMQTGWLFDNGSWYYLIPNGNMTTGWVLVDNSWFYMNNSGQMQTGWLFDNGSWYYLTPNGNMATGWVFVDNNWFYMNTNGQMQTGWITDGSYRYYLGANGAMFKDTYTPDGYYVDTSGRISQSVPNQQILDRSKILIGSTLYYDNSGIIDDEHFKDIHENGIDFLITETKTDQNSILSYAEKYNIDVIGAHQNFGCWGGQSNGELQQLNEKIKTGLYSFASYKAHKARVGDHIFDEPTSSEFSAIGEFFKLYKNNTQNKFLFVNLMPALAPSGMLGEATYKDYISKFAEQVNSDYICFDSYPLCQNEVIESTYLKSLNTVSEICRQTNRDMWNYIQTQGNWLRYILPSYNQVLWQAYSSFAFGSKAILHISYNPIWDDNASAMLDKNGNKTEQWYNVKSINDNIKAISDSYMKYEWLGAYAFGDFQNSKLKDQLIELNNENADYMSEEDYFNDIISSVNSDQSVLIGFFRNNENGKRAFVIVNMQNPFDTNETAYAEIKIPNATEISYIKGTQSQNQKSNDGVFSLSLESGEGLFAEIQ